MNRNDSDYQQFKQEFWDWFDTLPESKKRVFWGYKEDIAELNFYFTVWKPKYEDQICQR